VFSQTTLQEFVVEKDDNPQTQIIYKNKGCTPDVGVIVFYSTIPDLKFSMPDTPSRLKNISAFDKENNCYILCLQPTDTNIGGISRYTIAITGAGYKPIPAFMVNDINAGIAQYFNIKLKEDWQGKVEFLMKAYDDLTRKSNNVTSPVKPEIATPVYSAMSWYQEGLKNSNADNYSEAIRCYRNALEINPNMSDAWYNIGIAYELGKKNSEAAECYQKAAQLGNKDAQKLLALQKGENNNVASSIEQKSATPSVYSAMSWYQEGKTNSNAGNFSEAIRCYRNALEINPDMSDAWYNLGIAYGREKKNSEALEYYQKAAQLGNRDAQKLMILMGKKW
jgi:tetratricopeptide (TPR) repeat protein